MLMRFGSGDISTKIASDEVQIGPLKVFMENGVLLMVIGLLHGSFVYFLKHGLFNCAGE